MSVVAIGHASAQSYSGSGYVPGSQMPRLVRCESVRSRRTFCSVNTQGSVRLSQQLSQRACVAGRTWGYTYRGIWVSRGCRAQFVVGRSTPYHDATVDSGHSHYVDSSGRVVHCVATASGRTYCGDSHSRYVMAGTRDPDCIQGQTWGTDERGVWVSGNCSADFNASPYDNDVNTSTEVNHTHHLDSSGQLVHCVATATGRTYCGDSHSHLTMSGSPDPACVEGRTWGRDERGVWVSSGCNADFSVSDPGTETSHSHYVDSSGRLIHCVASASGRTYCGESHAHYVMAGTRDPDCVEGQNWGFDDRGVWVSGTCNADFTMDENYYSHH